MCRWNLLSYPLTCHAQTCPYKYKVKKVLKKDCPLEQKKVDDVMGDSFKNAPVTDARCPKCGEFLPTGK